uniref:Uncharacterized protein n=1 Tax=Globisporangium ultimum (strain ATCC 200006 / CBS 805.95 / DAOM BR144) TaxID=431595 RepID=K3X850_GLOUD
MITAPSSKISPSSRFSSSSTFLLRGVAIANGTLDVGSCCCARFVASPGPSVEASSTLSCCSSLDVASLASAISTAAEAFTLEAPLPFMAVASAAVEAFAPAFCVVDTTAARFGNSSSSSDSCSSSMSPLAWKAIGT